MSQNISHFKFKFCKQIRWHQKLSRLEFPEFSTNDRLKVRKCQLRWHLVKIQSLPEYNWMENCQLGDNHHSWGEKGNFSNVSLVSSKFNRNLLVWNKVFLVTEAERQTITNHELMIWKNEEMSDKTSKETLYPHRQWPPHLNFARLLDLEKFLNKYWEGF